MLYYSVTLFMGTFNIEDSYSTSFKGFKHTSDLECQVILFPDTN